MGAWGTGLYSSDFAKDLGGAVKGVARLPYEPDKLLELLRQIEPAAANDPKDPDHTVFWLVVAEQFAKRGIDSPAARERALSIIAAGADLAAMRALGMDEKSLKKRAAVLDELRQKIAVPVDGGKPRKTLKSPQKFLLEAGEVVIYPVCKGKPINPYAVGKDWAWVKAWKQDGWGASVVLERGLLFDFLAWYRLLTVTEPLLTEPSLAELSQPRTWLYCHAGTLTLKHRLNLQLKSLGRVPVDAAKRERLFPRRGLPVSAAVGDISIANAMSIHGVEFHDRGLATFKRPPTPRIGALAELA